MSGQMDDAGMKARPPCDSCKSTMASWLVTPSLPPGLGGKRSKLCTTCAKSAGGKRRALKSRDY